MNRFKPAYNWLERNVVSTLDLFEIIDLLTTVPFKILKIYELYCDIFLIKNLLTRPKYKVYSFTPLHGGKYNRNSYYWANENVYSMTPH